MRPLLLVTSAWHMPPSIGVIRKVGFRIVPYRVDCHAGSPHDRRMEPGPAESNARLTGTQLQLMFGRVFGGLNDALKRRAQAPLHKGANRRLVGFVYNGRSGLLARFEGSDCSLSCIEGGGVRLSPFVCQAGCSAIRLSC
jgi:hypothetical protein